MAKQKSTTTAAGQAPTSDRPPKATKTAKASKTAKTTSSKKATAKVTMAAAAGGKMVPIVMEGDSWERLPNFGAKALPIVGGTGSDLERALTAQGFEVENLAYWGDRLAEIVSKKDYLTALVDTGRKHFLLGGGGNDLLSEGRLAKYIRLYTPGMAAADYLKPLFWSDLARVLSDYDIAINDVAKTPGLDDVHIYVHGYDYARPMKLGWLGQPFEQMGIDDFHSDLQNAIVKIMIDAFNDGLQALDAKYARVHWVDFRNMVGNRWHDELHPRREAFTDLAAKMAATIRSHA